MAHRSDTPKREQVHEFLTELAPYLEADRKLERELDRHLARRFNMFRYLRTDELGLSRVISDLLDPAREHGQGTTFLKAMLEAFPETEERAQRLRSTPSNPIVVRRERVTDTKGRIDITVDIPDGDREFCLAFENKPYAREDAGQVSAYMKYLRRQYDGRFLFVYLPPSGEGPPDRDTSGRTRDLWENHFVVMPYKSSLADWFATCRRRCKAERVRGFLRDAERMCKRVPGETTMTANRATRTAKEHLHANPKHLRTALAVHDAWRLVRADICEQFLEHLRQIVEGRVHKELSDEAAGLHVGCRYRGDKRHSNDLWIVSNSWFRYDTRSSHDVRTMIRFRSESKGPNGWIWGISQPKRPEDMTTAERKRREQLEAALEERKLRLARNGIWWPQFETPRHYANWDPLVPDLKEECDKGGGPITTYIADNLLNIATKAIPAINAVEGRASNQGH